MPRALIRLAVMLASLAAIMAAGACLASGPASMLFEAQGQDAAASSINHLSDLANVDITVDEVVVSGLDHPVHVTHAGDGSGRLFIVEQRGIIRIVKNGSLLSTSFLDITDRVEYGGEQGLLSVAFPPDYASRKHFYVNYTGKPDGNTRVSRFSASGDAANPASEAILLTVAQPYANHNGGQLAFGPNDGYLYIGMGDGGSGGDPQNYAQNPNSLLGKMLRIDVESGAAPYAIPTDNPLVGTGSGRDEIWALGLRNPWRFSFDRATGDMYIADVGQNAWEEIDFQAANTWGGLNFGWRCQEGTHEYDFTGICPSLSLVDPIAEYSRNDGRSVTGGFVYRGALYPVLAGRYFYGDYVTGNIWSIVKTGSNPTTWSPTEFEINAGFPISSFGEDEQGELYVADYGGTIRRLADVNGPSPNLSLSSKKSSAPHASAGEVVTYTIQINNRGASSTQTVYLTDTIPSGLDYVPGSLFATEGNTDAQGARLYWRGPLSTPVITITYRATVDGSQTGSLINRAQLAGAAISPLHLAAALYVPSPVLTTTQNDVFLPGTQPGTIEYSMATALGCDFCHTGPIYDRWRGSPMGQAGRDPPTQATSACAATHPKVGWKDVATRPMALRCKMWTLPTASPATSATAWWTPSPPHRTRPGGWTRPFWRPLPRPYP